METRFATSRWAQKAQVLAGTLAIATVINLILLLLIASLVNCREVEPIPKPQMRPVEFIRVAPKPPEPKPLPPPPAEKAVEEPVEPPPKPKEPSKPPTPKKAKAVNAPVKKPTKVAAPKLDIPLNGTGASFDRVGGKDSRLTAPPAKWDVKEKPAEPQPIPLSRRLVAVSRVMPVYPWKAKSLGIEGWVKLEIIVATDGTVSKVKVIADEPAGTFAAAAINAIEKWRFQPAFKAGQAVEQRAIQMLQFQLRN